MANDGGAVMGGTRVPEHVADTDSTIYGHPLALREVSPVPLARAYPAILSSGRASALGVSGGYFNETGCC